MVNDNPNNTYEQLDQSCDPSWVEGKWRPQSMNLQTIKNIHDSRNFAVKETNKTSDIVGAQPRRSKGFQKPQLHSVADIDGAKPKKLHVKLNKPILFDVRDIEGAAPASRTFHSRRVVNPLSPKYDLPSYKHLPPPVPKFLRNSLDLSDVEGSHARKQNTLNIRKTMDISDIEGSAPRSIHRNVIATDNKAFLPVSATPNVTDINSTPGIVKKGTNPLNPTYHINDMRIEDESNRKVFRKTREPFFSLLTSDIQGASSNSGNHNCFPHMNERRHFRNINDVSEIDGATADTLTRALKTKRRTDPLYPRYKYLDGSESARTQALLRRASEEFGKQATARSTSSNNNQLEDQGVPPPRESASRLHSSRSASAFSSASSSSFRAASARAGKLQVNGANSRRSSTRSLRRQDTPTVLSTCQKPSFAGTESRQGSAVGSSRESRRGSQDHDHLVPRPVGLVAQNSRVERPHGLQRVECELATDHLQDGMVVDDKYCRVMPDRHKKMSVEGAPVDHIACSMIPESDEFEQPLSRGRKASVSSHEGQVDHIVGWDAWVQRRRPEANTQRSRRDNDRPETASGSSRSAAENGLRPQTSGTSRSSGTLRQSGRRSISRVATALPPTRLSTSRSCASLASRQSRQDEVDRQSVLDLPDEVVSSR